MRTFMAILLSGVFAAGSALADEQAVKEHKEEEARGDGQERCLS